MLWLDSFNMQQAALSEAEKDEWACSDGFSGIPRALATLVRVLKVFQTREIYAIKNMPLISSFRTYRALGFSPGLDFFYYDF